MPPKHPAQMDIDTGNTAWTQHGERAYTQDEAGLPLTSGTILPAPPAVHTASLEARKAT